MKNQPRLFAPVLALGIVGLAICLLLLWYGLGGRRYLFKDYFWQRYRNANGLRSRFVRTCGLSLREN